jgi:hypothetical protein
MCDSKRPRSAIGIMSRVVGVCALGWFGFAVGGSRGGMDGSVVAAQDIDMS